LVAPISNTDISPLLRQDGATVDGLLDFMQDWWCFRVGYSLSKAPVTSPMGIKKRGAFVPPVQADTVLGHFACPDLKRSFVTWIHKKGTGKERLNQQK
jgi:hypothetical protein